MAQRRFVVQKIGDRYVPVPLHPTDTSESWCWKIAGALLALLGLNRGGARGWATALFGAAILSRGVTGKSLVCYFLPCGPRSARDGDPTLAPSHQHDHHGNAPLLPADKVDEMSMESFPASDAPAHAIVHH